SRGQGSTVRGLLVPSNRASRRTRRAGDAVRFLAPLADGLTNPTPPERGVKTTRPRDGTAADCRRLLVRVSNRLSLRALLLLASAFLVVVFVGAAAADPGGQPRLDNGHGHWFKSVCAWPAATPPGGRSEVVTDETGPPPAGPTPPGGAFGPDQFHGAYSLPLTGSIPQTIGIVDAYDDPNIESDLAAFSSAYGLPQCTSANGCFRKVDQNGGTTYPARDTGWALPLGPPARRPRH